MLADVLVGALCYPQIVGELLSQQSVYASRHFHLAVASNMARTATGSTAEMRLEKIRHWKKGENHFNQARSKKLYGFHK